MQQDLIETATAVRLFIEPLWADWHDAYGGERPSPLSRNTCGRSSLFVMMVLQHQGIEAEWKTGTPRLLEEGPEIGPVGFHANGRWEAHSWVEANGYIIDITADQFGASPVIVVPVGDERYAAGGRDTAWPVHVANRRTAVAAIWSRWLQFRDMHAAKIKPQP